MALTDVPAVPPFPNILTFGIHVPSGRTVDRIMVCHNLLFIFYLTIFLTHIFLSQYEFYAANKPQLDAAISETGCRILSLDFQYKAASKVFVCGDNRQYFKPFESIVIFSNEHQKTMWYEGLPHKESIKDIQKYLIQVRNRLSVS
jgi:hypothetical protein